MPEIEPAEWAKHFTWEDVDGLRSLAESLANQLGVSVTPLLDLADRIAALLPPRDRH